MGESMGYLPQVHFQQLVIYYSLFFRGNPDDEIHYFSIVNSLMIVFFLSGVVAMIMLRTLRRDIANYNDKALSSEEVQEETGWKIVHGDVFRPPSHPTALAVVIGSGVQILGMAFATMIFALLGFISPANRGGLLTSLIILFTFMGGLSGYFSQKLYW